jgi:CDP-4-dehydro-6-deoxyglucose reductase
MTNRVRLIPSGIEFEVKDGQTILAGALAANINLEYSCSNGQCGECKVVLASGEVLSDKCNTEITLHGGEILSCASYPQNDLVVQAKYFKELDGIKRKILPAKVDSFQYILDDVLLLTLRLPPAAVLDFLPGQYIDLMWSGSKRSYSIASHNLIDNKLELHIKKVDQGLFSEVLFNELKVNQMFRLNGPLGTFFIREGTAPIIFICTGSGFAPVKSMIEGLLAGNSTRDIYIYWGARNREDLYSELPYRWARDFENIHFTPVLSRENQLLNGESSGYCQDVIVEQHKELTGLEVYACGSTVMIHAAKTKLIDQGLKIENFHSDAFLPSN